MILSEKCKIIEQFSRNIETSWKIPENAPQLHENY